MSADLPSQERLDPVLKPCPFCNGAAELDTRQAYLALGTGKLGSAVAIYCTTCSAHMTECMEDHGGSSREVVAAYVVERWNGRAPVETSDRGKTFITPTADDVQDASRYRWLRANWFLMGHMLNRLERPGSDHARVIGAGDLQTLDAAIDRALTPTTGANVHGIGPDTDGGPNPDYVPEKTSEGAK